MSESNPIKTKYYLLHRDKLLKRSIEYNKNNPDKTYLAKKKYYDTHKAEINRKRRERLQKENI